MSIDESLYWSEKAHKSLRNNPNCYTIRKRVSKAIVAIAEDMEVTKDSPVLDIGCNVGRNLEYLRRAGFHDLTGVDVSPYAFQFTEKHYPELAGQMSFYQAKIQDIIPHIEGTGWLVVSSAVLLHIQPTSRVPVWEWIEHHADHVIMLEPPALPRTKFTQDGRFLGSVDVHHQLTSRGFEILVEEFATKRMQYYQLVGAKRCSQ